MSEPTNPVPGERSPAIPPLHPSVLPVQRTSVTPSDYEPRSPLPPPFPEELLVPHPQAQQSPPPPVPANRFAIAGLVTSFIPLVGLILSFIGLRRAHLTGVGAKIAKAGIAASLILTIIALLVAQSVVSKPGPPCSCDPSQGYTPAVVSTIQWLSPTS